MDVGSGKLSIPQKVCRGENEFFFFFLLQKLHPARSDYARRTYIATTRRAHLVLSSRR